MGTFSKIHRFREAGESANINNVELFGEPLRSLFSSTKVMTLHHRIEIFDAQENVVYRSETKFPSLHDKTDVFDASGSHVAHIERKVFTLHQRHFITMADGTNFELSNELFHIIKDITNIEGLDWKIKGNIIGLNFTLFDQNDEPVAAIGQKMLSVHDRFSIDLYQPQYEKTVVAIVIQLQKMLTARRENNE